MPSQPAQPPAIMQHSTISPIQATYIGTQAHTNLAVGWGCNGPKGGPVLPKGLQSSLHLLQLLAEVQNGLLVLFWGSHVTVHVLEDVLNGTVDLVILHTCINNRNNATVTCAIIALSQPLKGIPSPLLSTPL